MLLRNVSNFAIIRSRSFAMATTPNPPPSASGPIEKAIREKLMLLLQPTALTITNDSHKHRHHDAMKNRKSAESHFSIMVVSSSFRGKNTLARHRMIHTALAEELSGGLHALSLATRTPEEV